MFNASALANHFKGKGRSFSDAITDEISDAVSEAMSQSEDYQGWSQEELMEEDAFMDAALEVANAYLEGMSENWFYPFADASTSATAPESPADPAMGFPRKSISGFTPRV